MLTTVPEQLPDDIDALKSIIMRDIKALEKNYQFKITLLEEKVAWLTSKLFGRKSEKLDADDFLQMRLFDEAETAITEAPAAVEEEKTVRVSTHTRKAGVRKKLPEWLPRIEVIHDLSPEEKKLSDGTELKKIGEVVSEKLDIIPPKFQVIKNIRYKYARPETEAVDTDGEEEETPGVITAPLPPQIIEKGIATAGLAAYTIVSKFCDALLPMYLDPSAIDRNR